MPKPALQPAISAFHSPNPGFFGHGTKDCTLNTRYCGLVLTRTIDSVIFSSAARERIVNQAEPNLPKWAARDHNRCFHYDLIQPVVQKALNTTIQAPKAGMERLFTCSAF